MTRKPTPGQSPRYGNMKKDGARVGKLQPRDRPAGPTGYTRIGPLCIVCGLPRQSKAGLKCDACKAR